MNTSPATTVDPVEIDTEICALSNDYAQAYDQYVMACESAREIVGERKVARGRVRVWETSNAHATDNLRAALYRGTLSPHDVAPAGRLLDRITAYQAEMSRTSALIIPLNGVYLAHRWTRYAPVDKGHIHSDMRCAGGTVRAATRIGLDPTLSGTAVADAVAKLGPTLCTHCFPDAPVEWTRDPADVRAEREAAEGLHCTSKTLTPAEDASVHWRRVVRSVAKCETCGATGVPVTANGYKRKHRKPNAE